MRARATAALLLLALAPLLLPASHAQGCGSSGDAAFAMLAPSGEGEVLAQAERGIVRYWWSNGTASDVTPLAGGGEWVASPDGRWVVKAETLRGEDCRPVGHATTAVPTDEGPEVPLDGELLRPLAANARHVALVAPRDDEIRLHAWGRWDAPERVLRPDLGGDSLGQRVGDFEVGALSADGRWLALAGYGHVHVLHAASGVRTDGDLPGLPVPVVAAAFSPDGRALAVLTSEGDAFGRVWVHGHEEGPLTWREAEAFGQAPLGIAWDPDGGGLVATFRDQDARDEAAHGVIRRFADPRCLDDAQEARSENLAFRGAPVPMDGRWVVGVDQGLSVFDADLRLLFRSWPGAPPRFEPPPSSEVVEGGEEAPTPPTSGSATAQAPSPATRGVPGAPAPALAAALLLACVLARPGRGSGARGRHKDRPGESEACLRRRSCSSPSCSRRRWAPRRRGS